MNSKFHFFQQMSQRTLAGLGQRVIWKYKFSFQTISYILVVLFLHVGLLESEETFVQYRTLGNTN